MQHGDESAMIVRQKGCCGGKSTSAAVRPSCIECVEKHVGAAYVLLAETRDGYAHRLRAVGHLHEAEDESQEWPGLHVFIREARKTYQADEAMPDWARLQDLILEIRAMESRRMTMGRRHPGSI